MAKKEKMKVYEIKARVVFEGATMYVEASSEEEAKAKAEESPDFDSSMAEMVDLQITVVREDK